MDQLTSAEKEELRTAGKEVPPTPEIPDSDNEDEETTNPIAEHELECINLTTGGDDAPNNPPVIRTRLKKRSSNSRSDKNKMRKNVMCSAIKLSNLKRS